jgi:hypothetical protein
MVKVILPCIDALKTVEQAAVVGIGVEDLFFCGGLAIIKEKCSTKPYVM